MDYARILQNQATSIVMLDQDFCVKYLNESAETLMNTSLKRALGMQMSNLVSGNGQLVSACEKVLRGHGEMRLRNHELTMPLHAIEKQVDCIVNRLEMDGGVMLLLEMSEIESMTKIAKDEEFVQRQQSNQAVLRGLAHEIRNPLGGIRGAAQLLADEAGSEAFADYTRIIIREADRLTDLVNRMQAEAKVDLDQRLNIHQVLEHVRQLVLADGSPEYCIDLDYDPSLPAVRGNQDLLIQAMINVLRNAIEAVAEKGREGRIILRTRVDHLAVEGNKNQVVRIEVIDNGDGIAEELESRIFDPMVTDKSNGTGLGLPITAEIVTQHNGVLDFHSKPGNTEFRLFIPLYEQPGENGL